MNQYIYINHHNATVGKMYTWYEEQYDLHLGVSLIQVNGNRYRMYSGTSTQVYDYLNQHDLGGNIKTKPVRLDSRYFKYDVYRGSSETIPIGIARIIEYNSSAFLGLLYTPEGISKTMQATLRGNIDDTKSRLIEKYVMHEPLRFEQID